DQLGHGGWKRRQVTGDDRLGLGLVGDARARVARVIALLERPTAAALDHSSAELTAAIAGMQQLQGELAPSPVACASKPLLAELCRDLQRAGLLLRNAWEL